VEDQEHLSGVDWKWYLYRDIEPPVPALNLLRGVFIAERSDHLKHSRRVLHESHSEVALMAACMDRDGAIFLQVPIPLCPGAIHRQEPQRVFLEDEPNGYLDRAAGAPADDGYGDLAALLERLSKSILSHRVHSRLHHSASHTPAGPRFEADRMRATPILAAKLPNRTFRLTGDRRCACRRQERRRFGSPSKNRDSQAMQAARPLLRRSQEQRYRKAGLQLAIDSLVVSADWAPGELLFYAVALNLNQLSMEGRNPCATILWLAFQTG
jgi:hypothetical protein